ncbi:MAG TPA: hypothetical protein VFC78_16215 [Tepidisphaeraceae bacterium]|nr:hypothetical protein [Tepidisphaeraceae bacterium]
MTKELPSQRYECNCHAMETPKPLPYEPVIKAPKRSVLPIVALCSGLCALALYGVDHLASHSAPSPTTNELYVVVDISSVVGGYGSLVFGYVAIATSGTAFLLQRTLISRLSLIIAIAFWTLIVTTGF